MAKIFISYKRDIEPDTPVATAVYEALRNNHDVFIDQSLQVGEKWADRIQMAIKESDYLIIFLSDHSIQSEMVIAEVETAYHHEKTHGKPAILPVRLNFNDPLVYPLSAYLNPLQWAVWGGVSDTIKLISELKQAISGGELPASNLEAIAGAKGAKEEVPTAYADIPLALGSPEGTMPRKSPFYIERETDGEAMDALHAIEGVTITIKGPRQMGKSSLLNRLLIESQSMQVLTAFVDFQVIETSAIENADVFYKQFSSLLSWEFEIEDRTDEYWKNPLGHVQKTTNYIQKHLLKELGEAPILLAMDEVERMFASPFRSDFFSMLRSWHNNRARGGDWTRLNMALVTSTEPYQLIADLNQSPFNVGTVIELIDFSKDEVAELNHRHGKPVRTDQLGHLIDLLGGHPYLTRRAIYLIASERINFDTLFASASEDDGPFGDHLRNHLFRMTDQPELKQAMLNVIRHRRSDDENAFFRLRGAGLVRRIGTEILPRNRLYGEYFRKRLYG